MNDKGEIIAQKELPSNHEIVDFLKEKRPGISRRFCFKVERKKGRQFVKVATATKLPEWIYHVFRDGRTYQEMEKTQICWVEVSPARTLAVHNGLTI